MIKNDLFPSIAPYSTGMLPLDATHTMYWEQSGNPQGVPVLFLHGGPGAGATPNHRRFFDPAFYRIIVFDQRGAGRSLPVAELRDNTTAHLIQDIETLRRFLNIERWLLFGGSWGSTLGLAYGQRHPERCLGLILRGIFLGSKAEVDWFLHGMRTLFPEAWRRFTTFLPREERGSLLHAYYARLCDPNPAIHMPAAQAWSAYEASCSTLLPNRVESDGVAPDSGTLAISRIEAHYFMHEMFLEEGQLLRGMAHLRGVPIIIIQGRYDVICPIVTADRLVELWPDAEYQIVPDAGHAALEPGTRAVLVATMERFKLRLAPRRGNRFWSP